MADPGVAGVVPLSVPLSHACVLVDCVAEKPTLARRLAFRRFSPRFRAGSPVWVDVNKRGRCATLCFRTCPRGCASGRPPPLLPLPLFPPLSSRSADVALRGIRGQWLFLRLFPIYPVCERGVTVASRLHDCSHSTHKELKAKPAKRSARASLFNATFRAYPAEYSILNLS